MKERRAYYRRKDKSIVIEGKQDGKSVLIWTLPNDPICLVEDLIKASYFTQEKVEKIQEKIKRLDIKTSKQQKSNEEVPLINLKRTDENDAVEPSEEELEASLNEVKSKA